MKNNEKHIKAYKNIDKNIEIYKKTKKDKSRQKLKQTITSLLKIHNFPNKPDSNDKR